MRSDFSSNSAILAHGLNPVGFPKNKGIFHLLAALYLSPRSSPNNGLNLTEIDKPECRVFKQ